MKKKILIISLTIALFTYLTACGNKADEYYESGLSYLYGTDEKETDYEKAFSDFEKAKEAGKTEANLYLGLLYGYYGYPQQDYELARKYYEACGDNSYAQICLSMLYISGQGVEKNKEKAVELVSPVIDSGVVEGYLISAFAAADENDYVLALECFNKVLDGTEPVFIAVAMNNIGIIYENGLGVEPNYAMAMGWFEESAALNNTTAMSNLGFMYEDGLGVEQDYAKALEWHEKSAALYNPSAMNNIAHLYENGFGVEQDYAKALEWYEKSAALNNSTAASNIGTFYYNGFSVDQDYTKAMEWFKKSAELNNSIAMLWIGYMYENGDGVEQDYTMAMEWYMKSAELNNYEAMIYIGALYENGLGVEHDYNEAMKWYNKADDVMQAYQN